LRGDQKTGNQDPNVGQRKFGSSRRQRTTQAKKYCYSRSRKSTEDQRREEEGIIIIIKNRECIQR
jgi:hypothetical protein